MMLSTEASFNSRSRKGSDNNSIAQIGKMRKEKKNE